MKNIFISSTFRDMQAERDLVQERVLPALREEARKYGDNVGVIDLRWGVDTSTLETDEGSAKVLKVCLDEIDRSHPYMLIFLGERYGWIPNGELIERAIRERGDKYVTHDFEKSVTALEIEYGALSEQYGDLSRCIVCFREPVSAEMDAENRDIYAEQNEKGRQKLEELKIRIRKELGDENRLISYTCKWDESAQMLKDFTANGQALEDILTEKYIEMFQKDWEAYRNLSWQEKEQLGFRALMESKLRTFVGREALLEEYYEKIINANQPLILRGEVGSGKTALMSKLIDRMKKEERKVFPFFSGMGSMSKNAESLVQQMVYFLETELGAEHCMEASFEEALEEEINKTEDLSEEELTAHSLQRLNRQREKTSEYDTRLEYLKSLCSQLTDKIYVFLDALDQLQEDEHTEKLDFLFTTENIQMIASCTDTFKLSPSVMIRIEVTGIPLLGIEDAKKVAEGILHGESRDLVEGIETALLEKKSIGSPLYISLLIQRLNMMDQEELGLINTADEIASYGASVIREMPDDLAAAAVEIIKNAVKKISGKTECMLMEAVRFLAVSRNGLNMDDLRTIFELKQETLSALDMSNLMKYLDGFFYMGEVDRINFTHKVIREGILKEIEDRSGYEKAILEYIKTLDETDVFYLQEAMYFAREIRDYELAESLMVFAFENPSNVLLKAIKEEAINDEGVFYSRLLLKENVDSFRIIKCFNFVIEKLGLLKKELDTRLALSKGLVSFGEREVGKRETEWNVLVLYMSYEHLGKALYDFGEYAETLIYYEKSLECAEKLHASQQSERSLRALGISYSKLGDALEGLGQHAEALGWYEKYLECTEKLHASQQSERSLRALGISYGKVGDALENLGQNAEALAYYEKDLECTEKLHASQQSERSLRALGISYGKVGDILKNLGQNAEALAYYKKDLECAEKLHASQESESSLRALGISYSRMGDALKGLGQNAEALRYYEKSLNCFEKLHASQESESSLRALGISYSRMGDALKGLGQNAEALRYYEKDLECTEKLHESQQSESSLRDLSISHSRMGSILEKLGRNEESLEHKIKALELAKQLFA